MHTTNASFNAIVIDEKNEKVEAGANDEMHEEEESEMASRPGVDTKNAGHFVHEDPEVLEEDSVKTALSISTLPEKVGIDKMMCFLQSE
ncbi:unnamed protein product [Angiostrongylus costaricensis]|uniref:Ovule protein n=1 Tax=Angiostrongylus costaricensis TaxID=334426 RepID=A0A0R3PST2_ANGCS|nr:unnamed protein product [Angiostrongylus costaricensis]